MTVQPAGHFSIHPMGSSLIQTLPWPTSKPTIHTRKADFAMHGPDQKSFISLALISFSAQSVVIKISQPNRLVSQDLLFLFPPR